MVMQVGCLENSITLTKVARPQAQKEEKKNKKKDEQRETTWLFPTVIRSIPQQNLTCTIYKNVERHR